MRGIVLAALLLAAAAACADGGPRVRIERAFPALTFDNPLFLTAAPGAARLYVATQSGRIHAFDPKSAQQADVFLDIRDRVRQSGGEEGLLGLTFHPQHAKNGLFYVHYTAKDEPRRSIVARYAAKGGAADPASARVLLEIPQPYWNHNGGMLAFGPDGMLYVGSGDGGSAGDPHDHGQRLDVLLGKILRLTPDGGIPKDNPFAGRAGARGEIWAYGLRNPWRFSFDRQTGELWAGDVGQNRVEEIDVVVKGGNYGWRFKEGSSEYHDRGRSPGLRLIEPVWEYGRDEGVSITGGYVYRGQAIPALAGAYVYADYGSGTVWALKREGGKVAWNVTLGKVPSPSSFGEDTAGELYLTSFDGGLYRLVPP